MSFSHPWVLFGFGQVDEEEARRVSAKLIFKLLQVEVKCASSGSPVVKKSSSRIRIGGASFEDAYPLLFGSWPRFKGSKISARRISRDAELLEGDDFNIFGDHIPWDYIRRRS